MELGWDGDCYFGDKSSSDAILELIPADEQASSSAGEAKGLVHTHTEVLQRSDYFAAALACPGELLKGKRHLRLQMVSSASRSAYMTCIEFMYYHKYLCTSDFHLFSLDMNFELVEAAVQIKYQPCIDKFLEYLSGIEWYQVIRGVQLDLYNWPVLIKRFLKKHKIAPREDMLPRLLGLEGREAYIRRAKARMSETLVTPVLQLPTEERRDARDISAYDQWMRFTARKFTEHSGSPHNDSRHPTFNDRYLSVAPQAREELYRKWLQSLEELKMKGPKSNHAEVMQWVKTFHILLDCNIADLALNCIASNESLIEAMDVYSEPVQWLLERIFIMLGSGCLRLGYQKRYPFRLPSAVPRSLASDLFRTWAWEVEDMSLLAPAFRKLNYLDQAEHIKLHFATTVEGEEM